MKFLKNDISDRTMIIFINLALALFVLGGLVLVLSIGK